MKEIWKEVKGCDQHYEISNMGRSKNSKGEITEGYINDKGYKILHYRRNGKDYYPSVHRLVAEYFVENEENKPFVDHIDEDKLNNVYTNLQWVTNSENLRKRPKSKKRRIHTVAQKDLNGNIIAKFNGCADAALKTGFVRTGIQGACYNRVKTYKGFVWEYLD